MYTLKKTFDKSVYRNTGLVINKLNDAFVNHDDPLFCDGDDHYEGSIESDESLAAQVEALNFAFDTFEYESVAELRMGRLEISGGQSLLARNVYEEMNYVRASPADLTVKYIAVAEFINNVAFEAFSADAMTADHDFRDPRKRPDSVLPLPWVDL